jgi:hypothetical protein
LQIALLADQFALNALHNPAIFTWDVLYTKSTEVEMHDIPELVKAYGKWTSFAYLCLAAVGPGLGIAVVWLLR